MLRSVGQAAGVLDRLQQLDEDEVELSLAAMPDLPEGDDLDLDHDAAFLFGPGFPG